MSTLVDFIADKKLAGSIFNQSAQGSASALFLSTSGKDALVFVTANDVVLGDGNGSYLTARNVALTINSATTGANGMDVGGVPASSWLSVWLAQNPQTAASIGLLVLAPVLTGNTTINLPVVAGLASTASMRVGMPFAGANFPSGTVVKTIDSANQITASQLASATTVGTSLTFAYEPILPAGYTHKARAGWVHTDPTANKYPLGFTQRGRRIQYLVNAASNTPNLPIMASGAAGNISTPTWVAVATSAFVPPTASEIIANIATGSNNTAGTSPNSSYGGVGSLTNPPFVVIGVSGNAEVVTASMILETSNIYWANNGACALACSGWIDNL